MTDYSSTIPAECPITLEHAKIHLDSAIEHEGKDSEQAAHDADVAGRILLTIAHREAEIRSKGGGA